MRSVTCAGCGMVGWAEGECCKRCGRPSHSDAQPPAPARTRPQAFAPAPRPAAFAQPQGHGAGYNYSPGPGHFGEQGKKRKGFAVASLVIGIIGFFTLGILFVGSVIGLVFGVSALTKQGKEPAVYGGRGLAIAGIVLNVLAVVIIVPVGIVGAIAIPNLLAARRAANEASAIGTLRKIAVAEENYRAAAGEFGDLEQLVSANLLERGLLTEPKHGYRFGVEVSGGDFDAAATPVSESTGTRSFFVTSADPGEIHFRRGTQPAGRYDPTLDNAYSPSPRRVSSPAGPRGPALLPAN